LEITFSIWLSLELNSVKADRRWRKNGDAQESGVEEARDLRYARGYVDADDCTQDVVYCTQRLRRLYTINTPNPQRNTTVM